MLIIRLQRIGKTKRPTYRLVVSEKIHDPQYGSLEILGNYNPIVNPKQINLKVDRIKYWMSVGAQLSPTVHNLLLGQKVIEGKKKKAVSLSNARRKKIADKKAKEAPTAQATPADESPKT